MSSRQLYAYWWCRRILLSWYWLSTGQSSYFANGSNGVCFVVKILLHLSIMNLIKVCAIMILWTPTTFWWLLKMLRSRTYFQSNRRKLAFSTGITHCNDAFKCSVYRPHPVPCHWRIHDHDHISHEHKHKVSGKSIISLNFRSSSVFQRQY